MLLLHTSDWHLGRTLHGFSLGDEQAAAVQAIVEEAIARRVDAVIVAGDVFDRAVPPVDALRVFNDALMRLAAADIAVVVVAGNHDSGDRLGTYAGLLRAGVHIVGSPAGLRPVELTDEFGPVLICAVPYLDPDAARHELSGGGDPLERSHRAVMNAALGSFDSELIEREHPRVVLVGHAFVVADGATSDDLADASSDSERDLAVGGVQVIPASVFAGRGISYVALGHLHRPQQVRGNDPLISYSGSLLRYSLSEADQEKSFAIVELGAPGSEPVIERVALAAGRGMSRLSGPIDELVGDRYAGRRDDFVELVVTDDVYPERMHARLDAVFPYALVKRHQPAATATGRVQGRGDSRGREPLEVVASFFRKVAGREPTEAEQAVLRTAYERARAEG